MKKIDLAGQRFGRLKVISENGRAPKSGAVLWLCRCDCGNTTVVTGGNLRSKITKSCGCYKKEREVENFKTHGGTYKPEYSPWKAMRKRCSNKNDIHYHLYGGRGIRVCSRWDNFENFLEDMGPRPSKKHSIDRINPNGNYEPSNCRWATPTVQARNKRKRKTTKITGVSWHKHTNKYMARITVDYNEIYLGVFDSLKEASKARQAAEKQYFGMWR
jgi:hypothetical protein